MDDLSRLRELQMEIKNWRKDKLEKIQSLTDVKSRKDELYDYHVKEVDFNRKFNYLRKQVYRRRKTQEYFSEVNTEKETLETQQIKNLSFELSRSCYLKATESINERLMFLYNLQIFINEKNLPPRKIKHFADLIKREMFFLQNARDSKITFHPLILGVRLRLASQFINTFKP